MILAISLISVRHKVADRRRQQFDFKHYSFLLPWLVTTIDHNEVIVNHVIFGIVVSSWKGTHRVQVLIEMLAQSIQISIT